MPNKVTQKDNTVGGHQAGRDINIYREPETAMTRLAKLYAEEVKTGQISATVLEALEHWTTATSSEKLESLEDKLSAAQRKDEIEEAKDLKERIVKQIARYQFSPAAQQIFAFALASAHTRFKTAVWPAILEKKPRSEIDILLLKEVIDPLCAQLEPNPLGLDPSLVRGLVYYLTGNCHLRWNN